MLIKNLVIFILLCLLFVNYTYSQDKISIAVLELDAEGVSKSDARIISDRLRTDLFNTNMFTVIEREKVSEVLKEQGFQLSGCTSNECVIEVGKLIGVQNMVAGKIGKIGTMFTINVRIIDVETGKVLKIASDDCHCPIDQVLTNSVKKVAQILSVKNYEEYVEEKEKKIRLKYKSPLIAGCTSLLVPIIGHAYIGKTSNIIRGSIYTAGSATLIILAVNWGIGSGSDDGWIPLYIGLGINLISAIDAGLSANLYNSELRSKEISLRLEPTLKNKSLSLALTYQF